MMARSPGDEAAPEGSDLGEGDTVAFPLRHGAPKGDNVYKVGPGVIIARKYRVERVIGRGGMGIVVEARHRDLDARVAIKLLLPDFMSFTEAAERFMREARAVAGLQSQHVARVLDWGALESGEPYIVMDYLDGEDLARRIRAGPYVIGDAIDHVVQACDALAEAHARGIVHRDLKPANLFLTARPDGAPLVKLLDFGVSKILGEGTGDVALTQTTMILGSALYMSPEQMRSAKDVDHRTDIYALGVCLFEMIGGKPPYVADSFPELCAMIYTAPPTPLWELRPEVPEGLVDVIERCLARKPADRYPSVAELVQALAPYGREETRAAAAAILRLHAPGLTLPPPAKPSAGKGRRTGRVRGDGAGARRVPAGKGSERRRSRAPWIVAGAVVVAAISWGGLRAVGSGGRLGATGGEPAPAGSAAGVPAEASAQPPASGAGAEPTATGEAVRAQAGAGDADAGHADAGDAGADAGDAARAPRAGPGVPGRPPARGDAPAAAGHPGEPRRGPPGLAQTSDATARTPPPPVNTDLVQEVCTAVMPDGTRKQVPCN